MMLAIIYWVCLLLNFLFELLFFTVFVLMSYVGFTKFCLSCKAICFIFLRQKSAESDSECLILLLSYHFFKWDSLVINLEKSFPGFLLF